MDINAMDQVRRYDVRRKIYFWVQRKTAGSSRGTSSDGSSVEEPSPCEGPSVSGGSDSEVRTRNTTKARRTYAEVSRTKPGNQ
jgi:hypothetical protein